jgi:hypothetical protein
VQEWHGERDTFVRDNARTMFAKGTPRGQMFWKKRRKKPESIKGIWIKGLKKQLYLRSERKSGRIFDKIIGLEISSSE